MSRRHVIVVAVLTLTTTLTGLAPAGAGGDTLFVDETVTCDDSTANSTVTPYCTIQAAVDDADMFDTVQVGPGTYTGAGINPVVDVATSITITGAGQDITIIDGENARIGVSWDAATGTLSQLTVRNGLNTTFGGNVVFSNGSLDLDGVGLVGGTALGGGGLALLGAFADLEEVTIESNHATGGVGVGGGGGVYLDGTSGIAIDRSVIWFNTSVGHGGGIQALTSGTVSVDESFVFDNSTDADGGGIALHHADGIYTISESTIAANDSDAYGGGIGFGEGELTISGSLIAANGATNGAGIAKFGSGALAVLNSTIFSNEAIAAGGGASSDGFYINVTITGNSAGTVGGGLDGSSGAHVANSIIANNSAASGPDCHDITSEGHNLVEDTTDCFGGGDLVGNVTGVDPQLTEFPNSTTGAAQAFVLPISSPAVNAGNGDVPGGPWVVDTGDWPCADTDQRGVSRTNGRCDIGAYEVERVIRYAGANRYATAAAISQGDFPVPSAVNSVFIATGLGFADGLAASAIAPRFGAPLLLVNSSGVPADTAMELTRLDPDEIYVFGGTSVVPDAVMTALEAYAPVTRVSGNNRYATAIAISQLGYPTNGSADAVFIATGLNFPDALAAAPAADLWDGPVLLVPGTDSDLPANVAAEILRLAPDEIVVVGGTGAVSAGIFSDLEDLQGSDTVTRVTGSDRYATSANLADLVFPGADRVYLATGLNFADALAGGAAAGAYSSPILLVPGTSITSPVTTEVSAQAPDFGIVLGGTAVVSQEVEDTFEVLVID